MYLKSLTLKGFKSFADRTVIKLEPGVAAIVGPNGSGKSNISDAVLWVLGERNAKNLRGQSMEDVIFAGSSARKPVSVAEVELLLDNSDGTLPVDFAEVSIGRRMYRSGESEYLVNGNIVRRMDVLDILHDSGLGTGTNSIISQGNLDSVLSSKPEDRRALIEEAAGILKHKERKAKSERKLARMDAHLDRVMDVTAEVERQLKPLERKAKKALAYQDLSAELADLKLLLSVDDLRALQKRWDETQAREGELNQQSEQLRLAVEQAEKTLEDLQQQLHDRGLLENDLNQNYRRAQASFERLNSTIMLLREKRKNVQAELERLTRTLEEGRVRREAAARELEEAAHSRDEAVAKHNAAKSRLDNLEGQYNAAREERKGIRRKLDTLTAEQRALVHKQEAAQAAQDALRENLSEKRTRAQVIEAHVADASSRLEKAQSEAHETEKAASDIQARYDEARQQDASARETLNRLVVQRSEARQALDASRTALNKVTAERSALEELERASEAANPALAHALDAAESVQGGLTPMTHALSVPERYEALIEALLGPDLRALLTSSTPDTVRLVSEMMAGETSGEVSFVLNEEEPMKRESVQGCERLLDRIEAKGPFAQHVERMLGDVYVVSTLEQALKQHASSRVPARFATLDGCIVWSNGKISLTRRSESEAQQSALARRRSLEQLRESEQHALREYEAACEDDARLEQELRTAQAESLKVSESLANLKGTCEAATRDAAQAAEALATLKAEHDRLIKEQAENQEFLDKALPDTEALEREIAQAVAGVAANKDAIAELESTLSPVQKRIVHLSDEVSNARLDVARLSERAAYAERMVSTRSQEISSSSRQDTQAQDRIHVARAVDARIDPLLSTLGRLADSVSLRANALERESFDAQNKAQGLHGQISQATAAVREAHGSFDALGSRIAELRIEKGRLEVQVEAAIKVITEDCGVSLETAMKSDALENRAEAVEQAGSLERRIKNMGTINPDAAEEFEVVSERYTYLSEQLADMKAARAALSRIVSVIDERMRDDFVNTFNQVNDNFSEIFSTLFPGGGAHLSLVDPDDLENTGVDVHAQPVGKRVKKMSLLSGGEKSMTAMALLFAVYRIRQTPFYILDEVEAALDDTNLRRLIGYLQTIRHETQFIMITHQRRTMESADILYGVSMQADGVTKVLSQKLDSAKRKEN